MNKIKFSHDYAKLPVVWEGTQAILLGVCYVDSMIDLMNRLPQLIEKDTKFRGKDGHFIFRSSGAGIILTFFHMNTGLLFTTIRSYNEGKYEYYHKLVGETFNLQRS